MNLKLSWSLFGASLVTVLATAILPTSCTTNKADTYTLCDTNSVTYSQTITSILNPSCNVCHSGASPSANINLATYDDVKIYVNNGSFLGCIVHDANYSPMPKGGSKLDDCKIAQIKKWISAGAPNN
jgi:hypothetical protein